MMHCHSKTLRLCLFAFSALMLSACQSTQKNKISVQYYKISGDSTAALDKQIKLKGPKIEGGRHAVAVARIKMIPSVTYTPHGQGCDVTKANVKVDAKVTLPKWTGRAKANKQLKKAWDNIDRYTRMHESIHVAIAFRFAKDMENTLVGLKGKGDCASLRTQAGLIIDRYLEDHDKVQKKFDADEKKRFEKYAKKTS